MTPATATEPKLTAALARRLHDAEVQVGKLAASLETATEERDKLRERCWPRLQPAADEADAAKGIREGTAGGVKVRVCPIAGREYFDFAGYKEAHGLTAAMRKFLQRAKPSKRWTVKPAGGPKKIGAVEPA
jgi:hypothetical protein